jgi:hypothetical protein
MKSKSLPKASNRQRGTDANKRKSTRDSQKLRRKGSLISSKKPFREVLRRTDRVLPKI